MALYMVVSPCESPVLVSLDWFSLSIELVRPYQDETLALPQGWQVLPQTPTAVWQNRWFIMNWDGDKVGTFLCTPRSPMIAANRAVLEVANPVLYCDEFQKYVDVMLNMLPMNITGVQRADLCGDFAMTRRLWSIVRGFEDGTNYLKGLRRGVVWWCADCGRRVPHQVSWGGMDSVFHWKLYWKYKELHEGGTPLASKPYIEDMWRLANLEPQTMWRLEVSITDTNRVVQPDETHVGFMDWYRLRAELYRKIVMDKFVVREFQGHKDRRNDPSIVFFDFEKEGKFLRHKGSSKAIESDSERRVVCKMWKEFTDREVRCNPFLKEGIRQFLFYMFSEERNIQVVMRRFNLTHTDVMNALEC